MAIYFERVAQPGYSQIAQNNDMKLWVHTMQLIHNGKGGIDVYIPSWNKPASQRLKHILYYTTFLQVLPSFSITVKIL